IMRKQIVSFSQYYLFKSGKMKLRILKYIFAFFLITISGFCFSQDSLKIKNAQVKLIKWNAEDCDNTYDPDRLKKRITHFETIGEKTFITVSFSDNCCAEFEPVIHFSENKLILFPYEKESEQFCLCDCCFSIEFEITGLSDKKYDIYFKKKKIELSGDHYEVTEPSDSTYKGKKINRKNKYGFYEGLWMTFYKNGEIESISQYPEDQQYFQLQPIWAKRYYASGKHSYKVNADTTESWFEDGEVEFSDIKYKIGDTSYQIVLNKFEDRKLQSKLFQRTYPTIYKSDFDSEVIVITDIIYQEEYYSNGKFKLLFTTDTTYEWFENGQIKLKTYKSGQVEFRENGALYNQLYYFKVGHSKAWSELINEMYVQFYENGNVKEIRFDRYELVNDKKELSKIDYHWKWDKEKKLTQSPKKWKRTYPWKQFPEIDLLLKTYELD
ncbi:MAG TPA: hypothetical protein VK796_03910, partial [Cytophaga sp.]|nr:hypothetical protein [Cytophaga sp.]